MGPRRPLELSGGPPDAFSQRQSSRLDKRVRHFDISGRNGHVKFDESLTFWKNAPISATDLSRPEFLTSELRRSSGDNDRVSHFDLKPPNGRVKF